jgi:polyisoprenoid-binding protein YceI
MIMRFLYSLFFCLFATAATAAPIKYNVVSENTDVNFIYTFGGKDVTGAFNDYTIDVAIDFKALQNSSVSVTLKTQTATGGFIFGTQAMRSKKILNAKAFPEIIYRSNSVTGGGDTAVISGDITVRGITKPLILTAQLFRPKGSDMNERDNLIMKITGTLDRFAFGADGYVKEVGSDLKISIMAAIQKQ